MAAARGRGSAKGKRTKEKTKGMEQHGRRQTQISFLRKKEKKRPQLNSNQINFHFVDLLELIVVEEMKR